MDDTTEHVAPGDRTLPWPASQRDRTPLVQALVRPPLIVEVGIGCEYAQEMPLIEDEEVVQALPASTPDPAFRVPVCLGAVWRRQDDVQPLAAEDPVERRRELALST